MGTVYLDREIEKETESPVRVVSPPSENESLEVKENSENDLLNITDDQELQDGTYNMPMEQKTNNLEGSLQVPLQLLPLGIDNNNDLISSLTRLTSYEDILDRVDQNLNKVENELNMVVKFSTLVLENKESPKNLKVQQLMEILDDVKRIRERYYTII